MNVTGDMPHQWHAYVYSYVTHLRPWELQLACHSMETRNQNLRIQKEQPWLQYEHANHSRHVNPEAISQDHTTTAECCCW